MRAGKEKVQETYHVRIEDILNGRETDIVGSGSGVESGERFGGIGQEGDLHLADDHVNVDDPQSECEAEHDEDSST